MVLIRLILYERTKFQTDVILGYEFFYYTAATIR